MSKKPTLDRPAIPTSATDLAETKKYLDYIYHNREPLSVRELILMWGARARGQRLVRTITADLEKMKFSAMPPLDAGTLETTLSLQRIEDVDAYQVSRDEPDPHMLTFARFSSAVGATQGPGKSPDFLRATPTETIASLATSMLRLDYSQIPVVDSQASDVLLGVFSWKSYASALLAGRNVNAVGDAMESVQSVDLHGDLFANISRISDAGYCLISFRGRLTGIVTAWDLIAELEDLALPFLAVGRAEQELKRVATHYQLDTPEAIDRMMFGALQALYKAEWGSLKWIISWDEFDSWVDSTRRLRNAIAHHDEPVGDAKALVAQVHRMTRWLAMIGRSEEMESSQKLDPGTVVKISNLA